eukprot:TRINITY_DN3319_c1_g1_i1.p1 TRINITY_DN3319_c1_g1~~TRINITY_DN3319_c1_g1_i1.p1  ORF type:complete len:366 (-),score=80.96 TRINITY_DN3319_c1_g1_i1:560-1657(-)
MAQAKGQPSWKLFVGQIPKSISEEELRAVFEPYGTIEDMTVLRDKATGVHRGCAFLTYSTQEEAEAAILGLHNLRTLPPMTNPLQVKYADDKEERSTDWKLFIGMLPKNIEEKQLRDLFEPYGTIEELHVLRGNDSLSKGCGFIKFSTRAEAQLAINDLNGKHKLEGAPQPMVVKYADSQKAKEMKRQTQLIQQQAQMLQTLAPYGLPPIYPPLAAAQPYYPTATPAATSYAPVPPIAATPNPVAGTAAAALAYLQSGYGVATPYAPVVAPPQTEGPPGANLFIYHLPQDFNDTNLAMIFAPFGNVVSAKVFIDKNTGQSKCFGFVSYDTQEGAAAAITHMNGFQIGNKRLKVQLKRSQSGGRPY